MSENGAKCSATISHNILFFSVLVVEILVIAASAVFTFLEVFTADESHYKTYHPELSGIVAYHFLFPIFVYQIIWLFSNIVSVFLVHLTIPTIFVFTFILPLSGLILAIVILVPSVDLIITHNFDVNKTFIGFAAGLAIFVICMILFNIVRFTTLRKMMKKKKVVQGAAEKTAEDPEAPVVEAPAIRIKDPDEISTTFSRRSTMSMSEERYVPPPRF